MHLVLSDELGETEERKVIGMPTIERQLELTKKVASWYRNKALYFNCLAKRRYRPVFDCCKSCKLDTENGEYCDFVHIEIDTMSGLKEDQPKEQMFSGNTKLGKPKKKRPHKKPRNSAKAKR